MQFRGEFDAGGAGADDGHLQLFRSQRFALRIGADAGIDQPVVEAFGLRRRVEADRVLLRAGCAEIIGAAADGDDQRVVADLALADQQPAIVIVCRCDTHHAAFAVQTGHAAQAETEMMPPRLRQIIEHVLIHIHAAGGDLVQQRFPQMRTRTVDQRHLSLPAAADAVTQTRCEFKPAGAAADDNDVVRAGGVIGHADSSGVDPATGIACGYYSRL